jgi:hypothetical protein
LCLVELRGFEPLTPCMPSRDPHHSAHHKTLRSRALHQSMRAVVWWFAWLRRAELLRICCAKWFQSYGHHVVVSAHAIKLLVEAHGLSLETLRSAVRNELGRDQ